MKSGMERCGEGGHLYQACGKGTDRTKKNGVYERCCRDLYEWKGEKRSRKFIGISDSFRGEKDIPDHRDGFDTGAVQEISGCCGK